MYAYRTFARLICIKPLLHARQQLRFLIIALRPWRHAAPYNGPHVFSPICLRGLA